MSNGNDHIRGHGLHGFWTFPYPSVSASTWVALKFAAGSKAAASGTVQFPEVRPQLLPIALL